MSDESQRKATLCFQTGEKAVARGDFDYAIDMFSQCCKLVPDKVLYRQALRGAQRKKHKDNRKGVSMAAMRMKPAQLKMSYAKQRSKWQDLVDAAEEALLLNPWDVPTLLEQGMALHELGYLECAIFVLETAQDQKTAEVYRQLAAVYEQAEHFDKAIRAWEMVSKTDPSDEQALSKMRALAASATIQKSKFDPESAGGQNESARSAAPETYEARLDREIQELEAKVAENPNSVVLLRDLGDLWRRKGDFEKSADAYRRGVAASGGADLDLLIKQKEAEVEPYRRKLTDLEHAKGTIDPKTDPEKAEKVKKYVSACTAEILKRESEIYRLRIQLNADDFTAYFELGYRQLKFGELDEAIKSLQKGRQDSANKWRALLYLGVAFWRKKNFVLAEKNLADSLDAVGNVNEEGRKEILYYRGRVAHDAQDSNRALGFFNEIAAIDYGYKDVAKRIDLINAGGS
jgi:tetratricopeptide (TPR) repeat protein